MDFFSNFFKKDKSKIITDESKILTEESKILTDDTPRAFHLSVILDKWIKKMDLPRSILDTMDCDIMITFNTNLNLNIVINRFCYNVANEILNNGVLCYCDKSAQINAKNFNEVLKNCSANRRSIALSYVRDKEYIEKLDRDKRFLEKQGIKIIYKGDFKYAESLDEIHIPEKSFTDALVNHVQRIARLEDLLEVLSEQLTDVQKELRGRNEGIQIDIQSLDYGL